MDYSLAIRPGWSFLSHIPAKLRSPVCDWSPKNVAALFIKNTARSALQANRKIFVTEIRFTSRRP